MSLVVIPASIFVGGLLSRLVAGVPGGPLLSMVLFVGLGIGLVAKLVQRMAYEPEQFTRDTDDYIFDRMMR